MLFFNATDAKQNFGALLEKAQREPVTIRKQNRDAAVILSPQDYHRLKRLNLQEFRDFRANVAKEAADKGLTDAILVDLLSPPD